MKRFLLACLLACQFNYVSAGQDSSDEAWLVLQKAAQAARELSYKGVFVYQAGANARSVQITHMNYGQGEYARIVVLDGLPREVLSQGNDVVIFSPRNEKVVIEKRRGQNLFPALLPSNMDVIKPSYVGRVVGQERVGGRDGVVVYLDPRDRYRYGYKFWADKEYGLLLKSMTTNERNEVMEQIAFNQLTLMETQSMDWFQPNVDPRKPYVMEDLPPPAKTVEADDWTISQLPPGYRKVDHVKRVVPGKPAPVTHLIFSDGLASVSLFIEPIVKGSRPKAGHTAVGATHLYATVIDGHQVVAVGEVPAATVSQIASAVSFKK
ncbi:MAG TPA: MucB/RseB C-terminal domain-containing protein [Methylophilaceae bacterium]|nr:MucB/RseB C-terminal domain-containing protein [Methylophilaceae bacterium]